MKLNSSSSVPSTPYLFFLLFIIIDKVAFILVALYYHYVKKKDPSDTKKQTTLFVLKEQLEFVFIVCMSIVLVLNFNPWIDTVVIDKETKLLLFIYGILIILTSKYSTFMSESIIRNMIHEKNDAMDYTLDSSSSSKKQTTSSPYLLH
jgi:uncharacterized membrane protein